VRSANFYERSVGSWGGSTREWRQKN
jgi:hypothetical protein